MPRKLNLDSKTISKEVFPTAYRGYDPLKVDQFLDKIIEDYELIETDQIPNPIEVENLRHQLKEVQKKNDQLQIELTRLKNKLGDIKTSNTVSTDNVDLLKRIAALEKFLYNNGFNPNTIK